MACIRVETNEATYTWQGVDKYVQVKTQRHTYVVPLDPEDGPLMVLALHTIATHTPRPPPRR